MNSQSTSQSMGKDTFAPSLLYGTAWKAEETLALARKAIESGFRGFDTAAQPKHYREDLLGTAIRSVVSEGGVSRSELWLQTKFTSVPGQDPNNIPYDPTSPLPVQVVTSVANSLKNLNHEQNPKNTIGSAYLDCLILHAPLESPQSTLEVWDTMSSLVPHPVHYLGILNVSLTMMGTLYEHMRVKPTVVQNPLHPGTKYDVELRRFCKEKGIIYQGFWILKKNQALLQSTPVPKYAAAMKTSLETALLQILQQLDIAVLDGTTNSERMTAVMQGLDKTRRLRDGIETSGDFQEWLKEFAHMIDGGI